MHKAIRLSGICLVVLALNSCKNDLKIIAPYKEIPQVHAIITPQDSIHMIRINKIFLGEGNANDMAQVPDSVNYKAGDLTVWLERYVNGVKTVAEQNTGKTELYFRDSTVTLEDGAFAKFQRVYVMNDKLFNDGVYKLTIKNNHTGNVFTSTTTVIGPVPSSGLPPFQAPYYPYTPQPTDPPYFYVDYSNQSTNYTVRTKPAPGGFIHDLTIRIHYYDKVTPNGSHPDGKIYHMYDFVFFPKQLYEIQNISNNDYFVFSFKSPSLFEDFGAKLVNAPLPPAFLGRKVYKVDYICLAASQEYYDYLQFSAPSLSFAQEKTLYSNFTNRAALGIFTFRSRYQISKVVANAFVDEFANNKYTCSYYFLKSDDTFGSCP